MKRSICMAVAALLLTAGMAHAGDKFAIGVSAARADVDARNVGGYDVNGDTSGWRLFGVYNFTDKFGIEAGFSAFDRPDDPTIPSNIEVETDSIDLFAVGNFQISDKLDLFGKVGAVKSSTEVEETEEIEFSTSSTDLALAFGGEYDFNTRLSVRGEYQWVDSQDSGIGNLLSISGVLWFQ